MADIRESTRYYSGPGIDESELEFIGHGPLNRNVTFAVQKKDDRVYLLVNLGRENGKIVPKYVTDITGYAGSLSEESLASSAYNIAMTMCR